jgi:hypothetical protein
MGRGRGLPKEQVAENDIGSQTALFDKLNHVLPDFGGAHRFLGKLTGATLLDSLVWF